MYQTCALYIPVVIVRPRTASVGIRSCHKQHVGRITNVGEIIPLFLLVNTVLTPYTVPCRWVDSPITGNGADAASVHHVAFMDTVKPPARFAPGRRSGQTLVSTPSWYKPSCAVWIPADTGFPRGATSSIFLPVTKGQLFTLTVMDSIRFM